MKKTLTLQEKLKNTTTNLLISSLLSAFLDIREGTLKKENVRPQLFFWTAISFVFLVDTVVLQGFGFGIDDYEFIKIYYRNGISNPKQGIIFTLCTIIMGVICSYFNLLLFIWMKHYDEPLDSERLPGYNFSKSYRFVLYLILFFISGYGGSFLMSLFAIKFMNLNAGILFNSGDLNNINFATPLRQMPECLIIMWSFLGLDFYLKNIKGQMEWRDEKEKMEIKLKEDRQKLAFINAEINNKKIENDRAHEDNIQRQIALKEAVINLGEIAAKNERKEREAAETLEILKAEIEIINGEVKKLEEENRAKDIQQRIFKSKFDAHLFVNVLSNVYRRIEKIDTDAADIILSLTNLFKYLLKLNNNDVDIVSLSDDVEHILEYIKLNKLTCGERMNVYEDGITEQVKKETILKIERGILDEFITNAFKYASNDVAEGEIPFIKFQLGLEDDDCLVFCVENTTIITDEPKVLSNSFNSGLEIIQDRLNHLYPNNHELEYGLLKDVGRYIVNLKIRLNYEN
jgi:Histidine kinase